MYEIKLIISLNQRMTQAIMMINILKSDLNPMKVYHSRKNQNA